MEVIQKLGSRSSVLQRTAGLILKSFSLPKTHERETDYGDRRLLEGSINPERVGSRQSRASGMSFHGSRLEVDTFASPLTQKVKKLVFPFKHPI